MKIELTNADGITLKTKGKYCSEDIDITPKLQTKEATTNGKVTSDNGYVGLKEVTVNVPTSIDTSDATAIAADIRLGKTAYAKDAKLTGTIEDYDGAASQGSGNYTVKVIDYDGTVLMEKKGNTGDVIELPEAPTHDRLVFQKWSASRTVTDNKVTIGNDNVMVGATYTTASGQNEFDITVTKATGLTVTFNGSGVKDWGDGTSDSETSHTYTAYGDYMIKWAGSSVPQNVFGSSTSYFLTFARLAGITSINNFAFNCCYFLTSITIPNEVTVINGSTFSECYSLTSITIPEGVKRINDYTFKSCYSLTNIIIPYRVSWVDNSAFNHCYSLTSIIIPEGVVSIRSSLFSYCYSLKSITISHSANRIFMAAFNSCYSLTSITIPEGVKIIDDKAFNNCYTLIKCDFSQATAVPTLSNTSAFHPINQLCKIVVPDNLYDQWIAATNWSTYADYIYKASEVVSE